MIKNIMADKKIIDEAHYNLAYIYHNLTQTDNGRVIGYDNQHGYRHRHYFGKVNDVNFSNFEAIEQAFEDDWTQLRSKT